MSIIDAINPKTCKVSDIFVSRVGLVLTDVFWRDEVLLLGSVRKSSSFCHRLLLLDWLLLSSSS